MRALNMTGIQLQTLGSPVGNVLGSVMEYSKARPNEYPTRLNPDWMFMGYCAQVLRIALTSRASRYYGLP